MANITIAHSAADGTLVHGTERGDGTNAILKTLAFRWFPTLGLWGIPNSRDHQPNRYTIDRAAELLREAGHEVTVTIDDTHRPVEVAEADKADRQADRAATLAAKAQRRAAEADTAWQAERRALAALPPFGQPILVGHHSEHPHRKLIDRAHAATRAAIDATNAAHHAERAADTASRTTELRSSPIAVKNRIEKLEAEQRRDQRVIDGYRRVVARSGNHEYIDETAPATGSYRDSTLARMAQRADEIAYWSSLYAQLQQAGRAGTHSRETIAKGDLIRYHGTWYTVARVNPKSVSIHLHPGVSWTHTVAYHKISGHKSAPAADS